MTILEDAFRETFPWGPKMKQKPKSEYETHVRRCPTCRIATTSKELCEIGLTLRMKENESRRTIP